MQRGLVADINTEYGHSIVAIVGEGMAFRRGTGATFTKAMTTAGVNIRAIAQGSSERQISLVVEAEDCSKALRAAHAALALSSTQISIAVLGATGDVGTEFLQQLVESQMAIADASEAGGKRQIVSELNVAFKVTAPLPPFPLPLALPSRFHPPSPPFPSTHPPRPSLRLAGDGRLVVVQDAPRLRRHRHGEGQRRDARLERRRRRRRPRRADGLPRGRLQRQPDRHRLHRLAGRRQPLP